MPSSRQETTSDVAQTSDVAPTHASASPVSHIAADSVGAQSSPQISTPAIEIGGREGPEPTRFGDWEKRGRCIDF
ncbi:MAG TPA: DUF1674 domain-containing protein [Povalibacter sp.]|uniref:DUF1674 domain-containing protein n=1 Tax=Povalibacter sp. TaxID=1962978 RepID=UPI002C28FDB8|nr:succinate dehydrogenase assembly factor 4 [Povalibacter sp.]HMN44841.1 DUF1674 domain-containing protein [Povalibacter sp.]